MTSALRRMEMHMFTWQLIHKGEDQRAQMCQSPKPRGPKAAALVCLHLLILVPLHLPTFHTLIKATHSNRAQVHYLSPHPSPCCLLKSTLWIPLLACCKFPRIIVSMESSNSERQLQQQYNNTGTPPLWAPILFSITPLCPSNTSGVSLQRLHPHHSHTHISN